MEYVISDYVTFWQKYNSSELLSKIQAGEILSDEEKAAYLTGENPSKICVKGIWYDVLPLSKVARLTSEIDGFYHFLYIQINWTTREYYIGKANRKHWRELKRYQGSGVLFKEKYQVHQKDFGRYFFACCKTKEETEKLEAYIVDEVLLGDSKCLNLVCGGGGTSDHYGEEGRKHKLRAYMKSHPEQYQAMREKAKELFSSDSNELENRSNAIRKTMSAQKYREESRRRIQKWREENPEAYEQSREKNRQSAKSTESREKRRTSRNAWIANNPEKHAEYQKKLIESRNTPEAKAKRSASLKEWNKQNQEKAKENIKKRLQASAEKTRKKVHMCDLNTGEILKTFESQTAAAQWLVDQNIAKNLNCKSSISGVCLKKNDSSQTGGRKQAYGFGWKFAEE